MILVDARTLDQKNGITTLTNAVIKILEDSNLDFLKIEKSLFYPLNFFKVFNFPGIVISTHSLILPILAMRSKNVFFLNDLGPLRFPKLYSFKVALIYKLFLKKALLKSSCIIVPTEYMRLQLQESFLDLPASKVHVIKYGLPEATLVKCDVDFENFILFIGTPLKLKGIDIVLKRFQELKKNDPNLRLIIVSRDKSYDATFKNLYTRIQDISTDHLKALMIGAREVIFSPLVEGFGFPFLECCQLNANIYNCSTEISKNFNIPVNSQIDFQTRRKISDEYTLIKMSESLNALLSKLC